MRLGYLLCPHVGRQEILLLVIRGSPGVHRVTEKVRELLNTVDYKEYAGGRKQEDTASRQMSPLCIAN